MNDTIDALPGITPDLLTLLIDAATAYYNESADTIPLLHALRARGAELPHVADRIDMLVYYEQFPARAHIALCALRLLLHIQRGDFDAGGSYALPSVEVAA